MKTFPERPRGQSTVELVLGLLVFVTVLMFGIHFAEVGYLSIKVHEAAVSPLWDSTALRVHRMRPQARGVGDFTPLNTLAPQVAGNANLRYRDFDGRTSTSGDRASLAHVYTQMEGLQVRCEQTPRVAFDVLRGQPHLNGVYANRGGLRCSAQASAKVLPSLTERFLEGSGGFFQQPHGRRLDIPICAMGRAHGGRCQGSYGILLGDFAFADAGVSRHCPLQPERPDSPCPQNPAFYYAAKSIFDVNGRGAGSAASDFAGFFVGYSPIDENGFFMSYRGEEDGYVENDTPRGESADEARRPRNTGGVENRPTLRRPANRCFLGMRRC